MTQGADDAVCNPRLGTRKILRALARWLEKTDRKTPWLATLVTRDAHANYDPMYQYYRRFTRSPEPLSRSAYVGFPERVRAEIDAAIAAGAPFDPEVKRQWSDLYDAELAQLDDRFATIPAILERAGCGSNTIIVITGDHGERFFEHGRICHSTYLDEPVLHTPLILRGPGIPSGVRIEQVVRSIDLYPTLAALAGATVPDVVQGRSLLPILGGDEQALPPVSALASFVRSSMVFHMVRAGSDKLVYYASEGVREMYDLQRDPGELNNIVDASPQRARHLEALLAEWLSAEEALREHVAYGPERRLTPEVLEQLRSLGYLD
jgi:arylsulfatase A-like enzyme